MYTVPSTLVGRFCSHGTVYTCGSPCRPPWDRLGLAWAQFIKGHLLSRTPGGPAGVWPTSSGAGLGSGLRWGAMGHVAVLPQLRLLAGHPESPHLPAVGLGPHRGGTPSPLVL